MAGSSKTWTVWIGDLVLVSPVAAALKSSKTSWNFLPAMLLGVQAVFAAGVPAHAQPSVTSRNAVVVQIGQGGRKLGEFRQTAARQWVETNAAGQVTFRFWETRRDDRAVYLLDRSRAVDLQLDLQARKVMFSTSNSPPRPIYDVLSAASTPAEAAKQRPVYAIAHRVLTAGGVTDALNNGANAIEIDVCAYSKGWWADHDCIAGSIASDKITDIFDRIRQERLNGKTVTFVWLDIKNPNYCEERYYVCSVGQLIDDARSKLESVDVEIVLGFYGTEGGYGWKMARGRRNAMEGMVANGELTEVQQTYQSHGSQIPVNYRMMDYGYFDMSFQFGNCTEQSYATCTELKKGGAAREQGNLSKVFGWTTASGDASYVDKLLGTAGVDGLIYGFKATYYYDHADTRAAAKDIADWVKKNSATHRMATQDDSLFH